VKSEKQIPKVKILMTIKQNHANSPKTQNHITCEKEHAINERFKQVQKMKIMKEGKLRLPLTHFTRTQ